MQDSARTQHLISFIVRSLIFTTRLLVQVRRCRGRSAIRLVAGALWVPTDWEQPCLVPFTLPARAAVQRMKRSHRAASIGTCEAVIGHSSWFNTTMATKRFILTPLARCLTNLAISRGGKGR